MSFDSPFVEYLIIGTHTTLWLLLTAMAIFGIPLSTLMSVDATQALLALPLVYLLGMLFDSLTQRSLNPMRKKIRDGLFNYADLTYRDEYIAIGSPELYSAYEVRVRRVRVIGAAIYNWPLLGVATLLHLGFSHIGRSVFVVVSALVLGFVSIIVWRSLYRRAYKFRKNACDVIRLQPKAESMDS